MTKRLLCHPPSQSYHLRQDQLIEDNETKANINDDYGGWWVYGGEFMSSSIDSILQQALGTGGVKRMAGEVTNEVLGCRFETVWFKKIEY